MKTSRNAPCDCGSGRKYKVCCLPKEEAARKPLSDKDVVLVLMPTRGAISYETSLALDANMGVGVQYRKLAVARKPIVEARNTLARFALEAIERGDLFEFVPREYFCLWVDDDAWWPADVVPMMLRAMREIPMLDALFGKFGTRMPFSKVYAWRDADDVESFPKENVDCKPADLVQIEGAGFHFVLMRSSLLKRVGPNPFDILVGEDGREMAEDASFCHRAVAAGAKLGVGMGFPIIHVDPIDGAAYVPGMPAMMMDGNTVRMLTVEHSTPQGTIKTGELRKYGKEIDAAMGEAAAYGDTLADEMRRRRTLFTGKEGAA